MQIHCCNVNKPAVVLSFLLNIVHKPIIFILLWVLWYFSLKMSKVIITLCDDEVAEVASVPSKRRFVGDHEFLPKKPKPILVSFTEGPTWLRQCFSNHLTDGKSNSWADFFKDQCAFCWFANAWRFLAYSQIPHIIMNKLLVLLRKNPSSKVPENT